MYSIAYEEENHLLVLTLKGYWDLETLGTYGADVMRRMATIPSRDVPLKILVDTSTFEVQSAEVTAAFQEAIAQRAASDPTETAVVVTSMLKKKQAQRVFSGLNMRFFGTVGEARQRLFEAAREPRPGGE